MIDFAPLRYEGNNFWFWTNGLEEEDRWLEVSIYKMIDGLYHLEYSDHNQNTEVYSGDIPNREFFALLLKNCEGIKDLKLCM